MEDTARGRIQHEDKKMKKKKKKEATKGMAKGKSTFRESARHIYTANTMHHKWSRALTLQDNTAMHALQCEHIVVTKTSGFHRQP